MVRVPALSGDRVWDDDFLTRGNPFIKSPLFILEVFRQRLFPESYAGHYRPVQNITYMFDYLVWNSTFYGYHLSSLLFHCVAGVLLYLLLRQLLPGLLRSATGTGISANETNSKTGWIAFLVALLWAVHPVHSAAIDYVSGRADSLAATFGAGAWLLYLRANRASTRFSKAAWFTSAGITLLLALCSRESASLWPALFLIHLFFFEKTVAVRAKFVTLSVCLALFVSYVGLRHLPPPLVVAGASSHWPLSMRVVLMLRALGDYGRLMVFPGNLHMDRSVFTGVALESEAGRARYIGFEYLSIGGLVLLAAFGFLCRKKGTGQLLRIFGAVWFLVAYLPTSNIVELNATVAEHWLYLPSVGFLLFLAGCVIDLRWRFLPQLVTGFAAVCVVSLGIRSSYRSADWRSNEVLSKQMIASGGLTIRAALLLAQVYSNREDYVQAEKVLRKAIKLCPEYPLARNNLAHALLHLGKKEEAQELFDQSAQMAKQQRKDYPRTWLAALNVAHLYHSKNDDAHAIETLEEARQEYPDTWELICSETELLRRNDEIDKSLGIILPFAQAHWWNYNSHLALGRLYAQRGENDLAVATLRHASLLDVHETEALNLVAMIKFRENHLNDAIAVQEKAVARQPDEPKQYLLLSDLLTKAGRTGEAHLALAEVDRLRGLTKAN